MLSYLHLAFTATLALQSTPASWIWGEQGQELVSFQRTIELLALPRTAMLAGSCDNGMRVYVNGELVLASDDWSRPVEVDIADELLAGFNLLAVRAENEGGPAALQLTLELVLEDGSTHRIVTDASWRVAPGAPEGWRFEIGAVGTWREARVLGALGVEPWGELPAPVRQTEGHALPASQIELPPGFRAELVYTVPRYLEGSWVSIEAAQGGRLYASAQSGGLFRITPPPLDDPGVECAVERVDADIGDAQGLLWAFDALYVVVNSNQRQSGLYRLTDEDGDGRLDAVMLLKEFEGQGEHGPHAVLLGPAGHQLYVLGGNHTELPLGVVRRNWGEDQLLPQRKDPRGHAAGILAPGGWVVRTDRDGRDWELVCWGLRNAYDADFNERGALFTYDSDMEWDVGLPWYRPTRVLHVVKEADYGWRTGSGKWPDYYADSLPSAVDIGLGSPTGVVFGTAASFPKRYREALFIADWAYGVIHAVDLEPRGVSYGGSFEPFAKGTPMPVTDLTVAQDGALYFTVGGRGTQSALYRVVYEGDPDQEPRSEQPVSIRRPVFLLPEEAFRFGVSSHPDLGVGPSTSEQVWQLFALGFLNDADRFVRFAARVKLEGIEIGEWKARALGERRPRALVEAMIALARSGEPEHLNDILGRIAMLQLDDLDEQTTLGALRACALAFVRLGPGQPELRTLVAAHFGRFWPDGREKVDRELCRLLVYLEHPEVSSRGVALLKAARDQRQAIYYAFLLRNVKQGWSGEDRRAYFAVLDRLQTGSAGGASLAQYLENIRSDAEEGLGEPLIAELRAALAARVEEQRPALNLVGRPTRRWELAELDPGLARLGSGRSFETGAAAYRAATCHSCHRLAGKGGNTGPDLDGAAGRFQPRDLLDAILRPSAIISDQYTDVELVTEDGELYIGRIQSEEEGVIALLGLPPEEQTIEFSAAEIASRRAHPLSRMPEGLLDRLTEEEILDLLAYVLAAGDGGHAAFD